MTPTPLKIASLLGIAALAGACSSENPVVVQDSGTTVDTPPPPQDVPATPDVPRDVPVDRPVDAGGNSCAGAPIEDLGMLGTVMGDTLRYTGNNNMAPTSQTSGIQVPSSLMTACNFTTIHQRVFSYTLRTNASLRISTSNPGTDPMFDTTLLVLPQRACTASPRVLFCNDDDPGAPAGMTLNSSTVTTPVIPMGTTILIGVGGFNVAMGATTSSTGTFELSVRELTPIAAGMPCDNRRITTGACADNTSCVADNILGFMGTCRAVGSAPGAACNSGMCDTGMACDGTRNICYRVQPNGMGCDRFSDGWERCADGSSCVNLQLGSIRGVCRVNGTAAGSTCDSSGTCMGGTNLLCASSTTGGTCLNAAMSHGPCSTFDQRCPMGQSCVIPAVGQTQGTCTDNGTIAGSPCTGMCTGAGLTCNTMLTTPICQGSANAGEACNAFAPCRTGQTCFLTDLSDRFRGRCFAEGALGGPCRQTAPFCDTGSSCSVAMPSATNAGRCQREVAAGMPCELVGVTRCATGSTCVHNGPSGNAGTCQANGTRAGAACRDTDPRCDMGLTCSTTRGAGLCQAASTMACSPRFNDQRCPMGQTCRASSLEVGACASTSPEMESNDAVSMAQSVMTLPASIAGALSRFDTDCYSFDVPAMGRVFARANYPSGLCVSGQLALDLYGPMAAYLGSATTSGAFGCPQIDGAYLNGTTQVFPWARDLAAGRYTVCVRNPATGRPAVDGYVLDLATSTPM